jgi:amidase
MPVPSNTTWEGTSAAKVAARDALIPSAWLIEPTKARNVMDVPKHCGILSQAELGITEKAAPDLVSLMLDGTLKSYDVVLAFCKRAAIAQQLVSG